MTSRLLSVIIPVFDERNTVGEVMRRVRNVELPEGLEREIIVVDDGSKDGTDKVLRTIEDSTVRVIRHTTNHGQGAAVRSGLEVPRGEVVLIQDADLEYNPADIPRLLAPILANRAEVVYGSRFHPENSTMRLSSLLADRVLSVATCVLYNTTLTDVETGYRAFSAYALRSIQIESEGFDYGPEVTAKLLRSHARFSEVPVQYSGRIEGRKFGSRDRVSALRTLLRQRLLSASKFPKLAERDADVVDLRDRVRSV